MSIDWLNREPEPRVAEALLRCCASTAWVAGLLASRPFPDLESLLRVADEVWWSLEVDDWLEAFAGHPRIGDLDQMRSRFGTTREWSSQEQAGVADAGEEVLVALVKANQEFEKTFGHRFIVCATGKSAPEMLRLLKERLTLEPERELHVAAGEQRKITTLRLGKLLGAELLEREEKP